MPAGSRQRLPRRRTLAGRQVAALASTDGVGRVRRFDHRHHRRGRLHIEEVHCGERPGSGWSCRLFADANGLEFSPTAPEKPKTKFYVLERGGKQRNTLYHLSRPGSKATVFDYWASTSATYGDHAVSGEYRSRKDIVALVPLPFDAAHFLVSPERPQRRSGHDKPIKLATGDVMFDERFWLTASSGAAALRVVTQSVAAEIGECLAAVGEVELEVGGRHLACVHKHPMTPAGRLQLLETAEAPAAVLVAHHEETA